MLDSAKDIKMKKLIFFFSMSLFLLCISVNVKAQTYAEDLKVIAMLKEFYASYIRAGTEEPSKTYVTKLEAIQKKYCTAKFILWEDKESANGHLDWDPLVSAQDFDIKWLQTLSIVREFAYPNRYTISYMDNYDHKKVSISLIVTKAKGGYKIDNVLLYDTVWLVR